MSLLVLHHGHRTVHSFFTRPPVASLLLPSSSLATGNPGPSPSMLPNHGRLSFTAPLTRHHNASSSFHTLSSSSSSCSSSLGHLMKTKSPPLLTSCLLPSTSALSPVLTVSRSFGVFDWMQGKLESKKEDKAKADFKRVVSKMIAKEAFTISDFVAELNNSVDSWAAQATAKVTSNNELEKLTAIRDLLVIIQAEMDKPVVASQGLASPFGAATPKDELSRMQKMRICARSGRTVSDINDCLHQFEQMQMMQKWLRARHLAKKVMPTDQLESQKMFQADMQGSPQGAYMNKKYQAKMMKSGKRKMGKK